MQKLFVCRGETNGNSSKLVVIVIKLMSVDNNGNCKVHQAKMGEM